ncbi:MAG: NAD(P)-binding domain-containing protein [Chloroflexi bacterium]|nr:NAD(P)-binding domain-containing protein [Chloroflexota bacterium]
MIIGMIGLGRIGGNIVERLLKCGHRLVAYSRSVEAVSASQSQGAAGASSLEDVAALRKPFRGHAVHPS